jgi:uncharacterized protein (DUF302 family)
MIDGSIGYRLESSKPFDEVAANIEAQTAEHGFKVLAVHDVQQTLADKGLERGPLRIIEVCNAKFAHEATSREVEVAIFMPCRYAVYTEGDKTIAVLARPSMISQMIPKAGLDDLATSVEDTLKKVMEASV